MAIYPPDSRPLGRHHSDLIDWNRRHDPVERGPDGSGWRFTANQYWLTGDDVLHAWLETEQETAGGRPTIIESFGHYDQADRSHRFAMPFDSEALAGRLRPADLDMQTPARVTLFLRFELGGTEQMASLAFQYNPASSLPAFFTGDFSDDVVDGSLVIRAGVEVAQAGYYLIDCNLFDREGEPVASSRFKGELDVGATDVALRFFGRILARHAGPAPAQFRIGQLRGARYEPAGEPDLWAMAAFRGSYQTSTYETSVFSDEPWTDPKKIAKLARLSQSTLRIEPPR